MGCVDAQPASTGTITDSAGVIIVHNPGEVVWAPERQPRFVEELRIGEIDGDPEYVFGEIPAIDVDRNGSIYALDLQARTVRVFDADGRYTRSIGRPGSGPGEIGEAPMAVLAHFDGSVHILHSVAHRLTGFAADGGPTETMALDDGSGPIGTVVKKQITSDGQLLLEVQTIGIGASGPNSIGAPSIEILRLDAINQRVDTLAGWEVPNTTVEFSGLSLPVPVRLAAAPVWSELEDGRIVRSDNHEHRFEIYDRNGSLERVVTIDRELVPVTDDVKKTYFDFQERMIGLASGMTSDNAQLGPMMEQLFKEMRTSTVFADSFPAFGSILSGPAGTIWVQGPPTAEDFDLEGQSSFQSIDPESQVWDVFGSDGRFLGPMTFPDRFTPMRLQNEAWYRVLTDELGVNYIARFRLEGLDDL